MKGESRGLMRGGINLPAKMGLTRWQEILRAYHVLSQDKEDNEMSNLDTSKYDKLVKATAVFPAAQYLYPYLGLAGEAGEVADQVKKSIRDDNGVITQERAEKILHELGDVVWYVTAIAHQFDMDLQDVMEINMEKLLSRKASGTIKGEGSDRR